MMVFCTPNCKKWTTISVALVFLLFGVVFVTLAGSLFQRILRHELSVEDSDTQGYRMWKETPIPMYLDVYMFNWTNAQEYVENPRIKPIFKECGPYVFYEHHIRENVTFNNNNNTLTYYTKRTWKFVPEQSVGVLSDSITTINPILVIVGKILKYKHMLVRIGANFLLEEKKVKLYVSKSVNEFMFEGYDDPVLDLVKKLNITSFNVPFTRFGWFVDRNESVTYDGIFNMNNGGDDIRKLGLIRTWNYKEKLPMWRETCAEVNGTSGELWYPPLDDRSVKIFSPDLCSSLEMELQNDIDFHGIKGHKYIATSKNFDNGTSYPEMECFVPEGVQQQSGVRNVSECKFGAPALVSYAHFYLADPIYLEPIDGLSPSKEKHESSLALEPTTGLPLKVDVKIQLNLLMQPIEGITVLSNVSTITMPAFWFRQRAELTENLADLGKILLVLPSVFQYTGIGFISLGVIIGAIAAYVTYRKGWSSAQSENEELLREAN